MPNASTICDLFEIPAIFLHHIPQLRFIYYSNLLFYPLLLYTSNQGEKHHVKHNTDHNRAGHPYGIRIREEGRGFRRRYMREWPRYPAAGQNGAFEALRLRHPARRHREYQAPSHLRRIRTPTEGRHHRADTRFSREHAGPYWQIGSYRRACRCHHLQSWLSAGRR